MSITVVMDWKERDGMYDSLKERGYFCTYKWRGGWFSHIQIMSLDQLLLYNKKCENNVGRLYTGVRRNDTVGLLRHIAVHEFFCFRNSEISQVSNLKKVRSEHLIEF